MELQAPHSCPFCGGNLITVTLHEGLGWIASCADCKAQGSPAQTPSGTVTLWNHRPLEEKLRREAREWQAAANEAASNEGVWPV